MAQPPSIEKPETPLTPDQVRYMDERIAAAVRAAVKRYSRRATVGFVILALGLVTGFTVNENHNQEAREAVVDSAKAVAVIGCNRDYQQIERDRDSIREGAAQIDLFVEEGTLTEAQGQRAKDQAKDNLRRAPLPDCRAPLTLLTSDPHEPIFTPAPLFPPNAGETVDESG